MKAEIQPGDRGQFAVVVDGEIVATKSEVSLLKRFFGVAGFPDEDDAIEAVRARIAQAS